MRNTNPTHFDTVAISVKPKNYATMVTLSTVGLIGLAITGYALVVGFGI